MMEQGTKDNTTTEKSHQNKDTHSKDQSGDTSTAKHKSPVITNHLEGKLKSQDNMEGISRQYDQLSHAAIGSADLENDDVFNFGIPGAKERAKSVTFATSLDVEEARKNLQRTPTPYWADSGDVDEADILPIKDAN